MVTPQRSPNSPEEAGDIHIEEQSWAVYLSLVALCAVVMGVAWLERPLDAAPWHRTAWPILIAAPLLAVLAIALLAALGRKPASRSLQLSVILGIILHVALAAQMLHLRLAGSKLSPQQRDFLAQRHKQKKFAPDYHPAQFVPAEDRPRQDFEKPLETESAVPADQPEQLVRQPDEVERSPVVPQPIPVPEQESTRDPNVVDRSARNEAAPRLADESSRLSRHLSAIDDPNSQPVAIPSVESPPEATPQVDAAAATIQQQQAREQLPAPEPPVATEIRTAVTTVPQPGETLLQRTTTEALPSSGGAPAIATRPREEQPPAVVASTAAPIAELETTSPLELSRALPADPQPVDRSSLKRRTVAGAALPQPRRTVAAEPLPTEVKPATSSVRRAAVPVETPAAAPPAVAVRIERAGLAPASQRASPAVAIPEVGPRSAVAQAETDHLALGPQMDSVRRMPASGRPPSSGRRVDVVAPPGPGGLAVEPSPQTGANLREAQLDSDAVQPRAARFMRSQVGGLPAVSTAAVIPTEAFTTRAARLRGIERGGGRGSQSPQTEEAIELGLAFLARQQRPDGNWSLQGFPEGASLVSDTAATAMAVLAFQGAGYNHRQFQYGEVVRSGLTYLMSKQQSNGDLFVPLDDASNHSVWLYSHSLGAIALCEAFGMTQDPALRHSAQKAIDFIVASQEMQRGGWRYAPGVGADTSVSGWMTMALKSGELAGLDVPQATYSRITDWLDSSRLSAAEPHLYCYNPYAPDTPEQRHGRAASKTMTAVGLLMRLYTGWHRDNPNMARGVTYLTQNLPAIGTLRQPERDTYYWYYATQVMAQMGGEGWERWIGRLHPLLVNSQLRQGPYAGSWDPGGAVADRWGPHAGRIYVTALNLLSLEVQHRKLPLYEDLER